MRKDLNEPLQALSIVPKSLAYLEPVLETMLDECRQRYEECFEAQRRLLHKAPAAVKAHDIAAQLDSLQNLQTRYFAKTAAHHCFTIRDKDEIEATFQEAQQVALPLICRSADLYSPLREYPLRKHKNFAPAQEYFQQQNASVSHHAYIESLYNDEQQGVAIIDTRNLQCGLMGLFGLQDDHGILQDAFAINLQDHLYLQLLQMTDELRCKFALSGGFFALYFFYRPQGIRFKAVSVHFDLISSACLTALVLPKKEPIADKFLGQMQAARWVYHKPVRSELEISQLMSRLNHDKLMIIWQRYHSDIQQQLDRPFGVTISLHNDVREAMRLAIRFENWLSGRLATF